MRAPRVGPWGPKVRGGGAARGAPWVAVEPVSCGGMGCVPPWWRPRQAASVHIRSGGRDREVESAEATVLRGVEPWQLEFVALQGRHVAAEQVQALAARHVEVDDVVQRDLLGDDRAPSGGIMCHGTGVSGANVVEDSDHDGPRAPVRARGGHELQRLHVTPERHHHGEIDGLCPVGSVGLAMRDRREGGHPAGCGAAPLAHRVGVVRVGLRPGSSDRDPVIAGGAGFTEGVVRERHGDDGVGGMAGAEDVVDAAKPMLGVEGVHAWSRDLVALDGREVVDEEIASALPHHVDIEDGGGHEFADHAAAAGMVVRRAARIAGHAVVR